MFEQKDWVQNSSNIYDDDKITRQQIDIVNPINKSEDVMKTIEKIVTKDKEPCTVERILPKYDLFKFGLGNFIYFDLNALFGSPDYYTTEYEEVDDVWNSEYTEYQYLDMVSYETDDTQCVKSIIPMFFNSEIISALASLVFQNSGRQKKNESVLTNALKKFINKTVDIEPSKNLPPQDKKLISEDTCEILNNKSEKLCNFGDVLCTRDSKNDDLVQSKNIFTYKYTNKNFEDSGYVKKNITDDDIVLWSSENTEKLRKNDTNEKLKYVCKDLKEITNKYLLDKTEWNKLQFENCTNKEVLDNYPTQMENVAMRNKKSIIEKCFNRVSSVPKNSNTLDAHTLLFNQVLI